MRSTQGCRSLNQLSLCANRPDRFGTSRTTKYVTRPPGELCSRIPSMVPIERETRLPSTIVSACPTEGSQTEAVPAIALPTTSPTAPTAKATTMEATATITENSIVAQTTRRRLGRR